MAAISRAIGCDPDLGVNGFIGLEYQNDRDYRWVIKIDNLSRAAKAATTRALKQFGRRMAVTAVMTKGSTWLEKKN